MQQLPPLPVPTPEDFAFSRLIAYAAYQWPGYKDAAHHRLIARKLEAVERGEITRLMIFMPPRHGKSMLASEFFPAWYLGRNPNQYIIASTYSQDLADDFGRKVKAQIADPSFGLVFPGVKLAEDSQSVKRFHIEDGGQEISTAQRGAYYAVGAGGPLTGRGAHLLLIDDPVKNREEADSEVARRRLRDWYTSTAYTRLMPGARIVVIQTRWHEDDLSGWLLKEHQHEGWHVLGLPALSGEGTDDEQALWPGQYPVENLKRIKAAVGSRDWTALYQQRPAPESGDYFKREWFKYYDDAPQGMQIYGASDYAVTNRGGDYTVHLVVGVDSESNIYLLDLWRHQASSDVWVEVFLDLCQKWRPIQWAEEQGQIIKSLDPYIKQRSVERNVYTTREQYTSLTDKSSRAQSIRARMASGKVFFPKAPWVAEFERELLTFPVGANDDQADALGLIGRMLDMLVGTSLVERKKPKEDRWAKVFGELEEIDTWRTA
jgi:predicted phage terminase large subunit-like protein